MARLFTIKEGFENLGALKSGGQASVFKVRREDGAVSAIKVLFTPIISESDKAYRDFQNEVEKLQRVNNPSNPHVVRIISSGLTDSSSQPYIEMEFIEGPDVEELLKPPHTPVFSVHEATKLAEHLASALAHCHGRGVKHGDIKSNNIKYNEATGQYMLLDFGLAILSDEQRRTSLRQAGAVEFMAPEQNDGKLLFASDVYSFGVLLFEVLAGTVPFPLLSDNPSARHRVMLAHMENAPPDLLSLRKTHLPAEWGEGKKTLELQLPQWLLHTIERCLYKKPEERFENGEELFRFIQEQTKNAVSVAAPAATNDQWLLEKKVLQQQLHQQQKQIDELRQSLAAKERENRTLVQQAEQAQVVYTTPERKGISPAAFYTLLVIAGLLAAFAAYSFLQNESTFLNKEQTSPQRVADDTVQTTEEKKPARRTNSLPKPQVIVPQDTPLQDEPLASNNETATTDSVTQNTEPSSGTVAGAKKQYRVVDRAYFHNEPDETTRRNAFIIHWNNAVLTPLDETDEFIYVVYTNEKGQTSKGWLLKKDLEVIEQ